MTFLSIGGLQLHMLQSNSDSGILSCRPFVAESPTLRSLLRLS